MFLHLPLGEWTKKNSGRFIEGKRLNIQNYAFQDENVYIIWKL